MLERKVKVQSAIQRCRKLERMSVGLAIRLPLSRVRVPPAWANEARQGRVALPASRGQRRECLTTL